MMFKKFGQDLPQSLVDAVSNIMNEAKADEPAAPDADAVARRKRLQALKDKQEDDAAEKSYKDASPVRKVAGTQYGGAKQKADMDEEVESIDELSKKTLGSYIKKASSSSDKRSNSNLASRAAYKHFAHTVGMDGPDDDDDGGKDDRKSFMRSKGIARAVDRMTKEEIKVGKRIMTPGTGTSPDPLVARTGLSRDLKKPGESARAKAQLKQAIKSTVANKEHGKSNIPEELKGNQHKIDANKNGKIDKHDFKLLRSKKKVVEEIEELDEKAVSTSQQKFMGMVYATKKGEKAASPAVAKAAAGMSKKSAKDYASTKHKGLPTHKEEVELDEGEGHDRVAKAKHGINVFQKNLSKATKSGELKNTELVKNLKKGVMSGKKGLTTSKLQKMNNEEYELEEELVLDLTEGSDEYTHQVIHVKTGNVVGKYKSLKQASRAADKKDNAYGGVAHVVKPIGEAKEDDVPFDPDPPKKNKSAIPGKSGYGPSAARHLARLGMKKAQKKTDEACGCTKEEVELDETFYNKNTHASMPAVGYIAKHPEGKGPIGGLGKPLATTTHGAGRDSKEKALAAAKKSGGKAYHVYGDKETEIKESRGHKIIAKKLADIDRRSQGTAPDYHDNAQSISDKLKDKNNTDKVQIVTQKDTTLEKPSHDLSHMDQKQALNKTRHGYGKVVHNEEVEELDEISKTQLGAYKATKDVIDDSKYGKHFTDKQKQQSAHRQTKKDTSAPSLFKMKEDAEQVDEVSIELLRRYSDKAGKDYEKTKNPNRKKGLVTAYLKAKGKANVPATYKEETELDETASLDQYIKSMGYDPQHIDKNKKVMFSKTNAFKTWLSTRNENKTPGVEDDVHMSPGATARG